MRSSASSTSSIAAAARKRGLLEREAVDIGVDDRDGVCGHRRADEQAKAWGPLGALLDAGAISAPVDRADDLAEIAMAIDDLADGRVRGKAVITVG